MKRLVSYLTIIAVVFCHSAILSKQVFDPIPARDPELRKMQTFQVREEGSIRYFGRGRLERRDAGLVLHLKGNHYEMGYQQGILLKDIIRDNVRENLGRVDPNMEMVEMRLNQMPPELLKELKGIAAGSGVDFKYLFGTNILQHTRSKSSGCSNVIVFGDSTKDGRLFHIRTFDFRKLEIFNHQVVCFYIPSRGVPFMGILLPGNVRISSGINNKMVSAGINTVHGSSPVVGGNFSHYLVRYILQLSNDIDEATETVTSAPSIANVIILTVADAKRRTARVFEMINKTERTFREPEKDFIISTNHLVKKVAYKPTDESKIRYGYYESLIERNYGSIDSTVCLDFLKGYAKYKKGDYYHSYNVHSILFDPEKGKVYVAIKPPFPASQGKFHLFHLKEEPQ